MTLELTLPPELEGRLRREAERQGLSPDVITLKLLDQHLPPAVPSATLPRLFEQWRAEDESAPDDGPDDDFFQALDGARTSTRKHSRSRCFRITLRQFASIPGHRQIQCCHEQEQIHNAESD